MVKRSQDGYIAEFVCVPKNFQASIIRKKAPTWRTTKEQMFEDYFVWAKGPVHFLAFDSASISKSFEIPDEDYNEEESDRSAILYFIVNDDLHDYSEDSYVNLGNVKVDEETIIWEGKSDI